MYANVKVGGNFPRGKSPRWVIVQGVNGMGGSNPRG